MLPLGATLLLAACGGAHGGTGTGVRDEGPAARVARVDRAATAGAAPSPQAPKVDVVALVRNDPKAGDAVRGGLKPCFGDEYPVDVSYGDLTGGGPSELVVNVMTCGDAVGIGSYVYRVTPDAPSGGRPRGGASRGGASCGGTSGGGTSDERASGRGARGVGDEEYENVFTMETPPVYAAIDHGQLVVTQRTFGEGDAVAYPSDEDVVTYRWTGQAFSEQDRAHHDFSEAIGGPDGAGGTEPAAHEARGPRLTGGPGPSPSAAALAAPLTDG